MGIPGLLPPRLAGKPAHEIPPHELCQDLLHRGTVGKRAHPLGPGAELADGLSSSHEELAKECQLLGGKSQTLRQDVAVAGDSHPVGRKHHQLPELQRIEPAHHVGLPEGHDRVPVGLLVAGGGKGIEGERILIRGRQLLFDEAAENPEFERGEVGIHGALPGSWWLAVMSWMMEKRHS